MDPNNTDVTILRDVIEVQVSGTDKYGVRQTIMRHIWISDERKSETESTIKKTVDDLTEALHTWEFDEVYGEYYIDYDQKDRTLTIFTPREYINNMPLKVKVSPVDSNIFRVYRPDNEKET